MATLPTVLEFPAPRLRVYGPEATIAEKLEAIVRFGEANTRYKDYFDLRVLSAERSFDGEALRRQIGATFAARGTPVPGESPAGLSHEFADDPDRQREWTAFLRRSRAENVYGEGLPAVVSAIRAFLLPPMRAAAADSSLEMKWNPGGPWQPID